MTREEADRESAEQTANMPGRAAGREWVLAASLLIIANYSALAVLDPLLEAWGVGQFGFARSVGYRLLLVVAGACVRPRVVGALIIVTAAAWVLLDVLGWVGVFNIYGLFAPIPGVFFEF